MGARLAFRWLAADGARFQAKLEVVANVLRKHFRDAPSIQIVRSMELSAESLFALELDFSSYAELGAFLDTAASRDWLATVDNLGIDGVLPQTTILFDVARVSAPTSAKP